MQKSKSIQTRVARWFLIVVGILISLASLFLILFSFLSVRREINDAKEVGKTIGQYVETSDAYIHYQEAGPTSGEIVLLFHGTGAWSEIWNESTTVLAEAGFRTISIDIPPFGYSEKLLGTEHYSTEKQGRRINELIDSLELEDINIIAHSVGSRPAMEAILQKPERIKRLILVDAALGLQSDSSNAHFQENESSGVSNFIFSNRLIRNMLFRSFGSNPMFTGIFLKSFISLKEAATSYRIDVLQKPLSIRNNAIANADWFQELMINEYQHCLSSNFKNYASFKSPVLVIWGEKDEITPLWQGKLISSLFENAQIEIIQNAGHIPYIENTADFNDAILRNLGRR